MTGIFISYRRSISSASAELIYQYLANEFSGEYVFKDVDDLEPGIEWKKAIRKYVLTCNALLVLIEADWVNICDDEGNKRLWKEDDLVRLEIQTALERRWRKPKIIPVLINYTPMPRRDELPERIQPLCNHQAARFEIGINQEKQIKSLVKTMRRKRRRYEIIIYTILALFIGFLLGQQTILGNMICTLRSDCKTAPTQIADAVTATQPPPATSAPIVITATPGDPLPTSTPLIITATPVVETATETPTSAPSSVPTLVPFPSPTYLLNAVNPGNIRRMLTVGGFSAGITSLAVSPDGMWVASGINSSERRKAGVWVLESSALRQYAQTRDDNFGVDVSAQEAWASDSGAVTSLAFSPTRPLLMIGAFLGEIFQFNLQTGEKTSVRTLPSAQPVAEMVFTPNNILLAADANGGFFAWDDQNFAILVDPLCMKSGRGAVHLAFSARQNLLVAGYAGGDLVFWIWDDAQRVFHCADQNMNKLNIAGSITSVAFNPSQNILAWSSDKDDLVYLWEMTPGVQPVSIPVNDPTNLAFSPDGTLLAVGHNVSNATRGVMRIYDVRSLQTPSLIKEWDDSKDRHNETINGVVFSPDGSFFASGGNADVRLWSIIN